MAPTRAHNVPKRTSSNHPSQPTNPGKLPLEPLMTIDQAKQLSTGQTIYHVTKRDTTGPMKAKVTSVKTWKTRPTEIEIRYKRGLYEYGKIYAHELDQFTQEKPQ
jgi:hypothetical protein